MGTHAKTLSACEREQSTSQPYCKLFYTYKKLNTWEQTQKRQKCKAFKCVCSHLALYIKQPSTDSHSVKFSCLGSWGTQKHEMINCVSSIWALLMQISNNGTQWVISTPLWMLSVFHHSLLRPNNWIWLSHVLQTQWTKKASSITDVNIWQTCWHVSVCYACPAIQGP